MGLFFVLSTVFLVFSFRFLSERRIRYRHLWKGALVTTLLLMFGKMLFGWYLSYVGPNLVSVYGAASSVIVFLIWVYYSSQFLYFGAEVVRVEMSEKPSESTQFAKSG